VPADVAGRNAAGSGRTSGTAGTWHPLLVAAFRALDSAGAAWCLLRAPSRPSDPTGDVDLLVGPEFRVVAQRALLGQGFARVPDGGSPDAFFLAYDPGKDTWVLLHVTSELSFGRHLELRTRAEAACLERRTRVDGVCRLHPEDEFWATLLHSLLDKEEISGRSRRSLGELARRAVGEGPVAAALAAHAPADWPAHRILDDVRNGRWGELASLAGPLQSRWRRAAPADVAGTRLRFLLGLARGLGNPWRRRGLSVALLGPDGAGKSTLAAGIRRRFYLPSQSVYMDVKDAELARVAGLRVPGLTLFVFLAMLWGRLGRARWRQARGELVVFDRYTYDVLTAAEEPSTRRDRLARLLHFRLFPRAGLALVLDVPGHVMFARKHERSAEELEDERGRLLRLGERVPNVEILDATRPAEQVRREATARIWRRYAARWGAGTPPEVPPRAGSR
jgi:thymidylate kinase